MLYIAHVGKAEEGALASGKILVLVAYGPASLRLQLADCRDTT